MGLTHHSLHAGMRGTLPDSGNISSIPPFHLPAGESLLGEKTSVSRWRISGYEEKC